MSTFLSPFQQHREKIKRLNDDKSVLINTEQSLHIVNTELDRDVDYLRESFQTREDRIEYKRTVLLPKWLPKAESYLQEGKVYQNQIFVSCIVWLFDTEQFDKGIEWALIAIEQNQATPPYFKRNLATFVADAIFEWSEKSLANGHSIEPYFSQIFELIQNKWRLHEEINAQWYKFAGLYPLRDENGKPRATAIDDINVLTKAKELLEKAHAYYDKIGVKTMIDSITARINALTK